MKRLWVIVATLLLCSSSTALSQEWSAEQKEVFTAVQKLADYFFDGDIDSLSRESTHPDMIVWNPGLSVPGDKATADKLDKAWFGLGGEFHAVTVVPLTIQVYDDFAIVNASVRGIRKQPGGNPAMFDDRWHSVWKKEDGKWLQIANYVDFGD